MKLINIRIELANPFGPDVFKNLGCIHGSLSQHWHWELEHTYYAGQVVDINIEWAVREDHAGIRLVLGLFGYGVSFVVYDHRHWCNETHNFIS
jgi:hypothetical protein